MNGIQVFVWKPMSEEVTDSTTFFFYYFWVFMLNFSYIYIYQKSFLNIFIFHSRGKLGGGASTNARAQGAGALLAELFTDMLTPCMGCMLKIADTRFAPCGHRVCCKQCAFRVRECPRCDRAIQERYDLGIYIIVLVYLVGDIKDSATVNAEMFARSQSSMSLRESLSRSNSYLTIYKIRAYSSLLLIFIFYAVHMLARTPRSNHEM